MRAPTLIYLTAAALALHASAGAQQQASPTPSVHPPASAAVTLVGCLAVDPDGRSYTLRTSSPTPVATAGTGASADGHSPSGPVTGKTPTGATATEAASPTPAVGTPPGEANPASPTFNREPPAEGSVSSADTEGGRGVTVYRLEGSRGVHLRAHTGHTVEVTGHVSALPIGAAPCCAGMQGPSARSHEPEAKQPNAAAIGTGGAESAPHGRESASPETLMFTVTGLRDVAATCRH